MAEYGVDIALRVTGEDRLNKVLRVAGQLENRLKAIKAIDITAPGAGKLGDDIRKALKPFQDLARESVNTGKGLKNTQARMQALGESFQFLASNAKIGSAAFKNFTVAADNQSRALKKVAIEQENIIRSARGMQSVEERQIQLARRRIRLLELRRKRQQELNLAESVVRGGPRSPVGGSTSIPGSPAFVARQRREALSNALIGGAFPLLFGQGIGAAAGGAAGGGLGGLAGGQLGFGLSLVGTAIGSLFDQLANNAKEAAKSLRDPITNFQAVKVAAVLASGAQERYVETLIKTGKLTQANAVIQEEITKRIGTEGVKDLNNLDVANTKFLRTLGELGLQLSGFVAGPLAAFLSSVNEGLSVFTRANRASAESRSFLERLPADKRAEFLQRNVQLGNQLGFAGPQERDRRLAALRAEFEPFAASLPAAQLTPEAQQQQKIQQGITGEMQLQAQLAEKQLVIARQNGTVSAAARALAAQAANDIEYEIAKLGIKNQMLREGFDLERNQALHRQAALNHQARQAAIAEQQRQQELADLQQRISLTAQSLQLSAQAHSLDEQIRSLGVTQEKALENKLLSLKEQHSFQSLALQMEHEAARLSDDYLKNQKEINENHKLQTDNLARQQNLELAQISRQRELLALTRMRSDHERQLQSAQTQAGFQSQLAGAGINPFVGPFGESARAEQQMALDFALQIKNKQLEIQQLTDEMRIADDEERKQLEDRRQGLQNLLALYQEYQPQINAATLEQQRFNEALQFTQPVVDGVFQSLTAVADGTKTAQQAFADFLMTIANMLVDVAAQMIATYIAIGIARSFAGVPSGEKASIPGSIGTMTNGAVVTPTGFQGQFGGFAANGGQIQGGKSYIVGERGPELFTPGASGFVTPNHALGMGGGSNIVVNVDATGSSVQGNQPDAAQLGRAIGAAVQAELIKQKRPGGLLA